MIDIDPIVDSLMAIRSRRQPSFPQDDRPQRQPLREIQRNIRLPRSNQKPPMFRHPKPTLFSLPKFSPSSPCDGFDESERQLPIKSRKSKRSFTKSMTFSGVLPLTDRIDLGPIEPVRLINAQREGVDTSPAIRSSRRAGKNARMKPDGFIERFKQLDVSSASSHLLAQSIMNAESAASGRNQASLKARVLGELAALTAPARLDDETEEQTDSDGEENADEETSVDLEDHCSEQAEGLDAINRVESNTVSHSKPRSICDGKGLPDADVFAEFLSPEDREEYLSQPGQVCRMKSDGGLIQVQEEIEDPSSSPHGNVWTRDQSRESTVMKRICLVANSVPPGLHICSASLLLVVHEADRPRSFE